MSIPSITTINDIFFAAVARDLDRMMLYRDAGKWLPVTSREFGRSVARTAHALHAWGVRPGDRIAILSENRPEWPVADMASLLLGAVTVPLYTTLTAEQTAFVLNDAGCRAIFLSSDQQLHKVLSILPRALPNTKLEKVVVMDPVEFIGDLAPFARQCVTMNQITAQGAETLDADLETRARSIGPDDLATIVYTSGTTGTSKGAMLTHGNITSNILCSLQGFNMRPGLISISFLPLCHITARHVDFAMIYHGVTLAYSPFMDRLPANLLEVQPSIFVAVPRVYEKIYAKAEQTAKGLGKRTLYDWALSVGHCNENRRLYFQQVRGQAIHERGVGQGYAVIDHGEIHVAGGDVAERQKRNADQAGPHVEALQRAQNVGSDVAVGEHRPFGRAGGAGSVDDGGQVVGANRARSRFQIGVESFRALRRDLIHGDALARERSEIADELHRIHDHDFFELRIGQGRGKIDRTLCSCWSDERRWRGSLRRLAQTQFARR